MRRGAKPAKAKVEAKLPVARKSPKNEASTVHELEKRLAEALKREAEAREQQTATSEILRVISSSPTDVQPVLDAVAENAARLCGATDATIRRLEGDTLRLVARFGSIPFVAPEVIPVSRNYPTGLCILERRTIHIEDILPRLETEFPKISRELRTVLATPLLREGVPIGAIVIRRAEVQPFTDVQIGLLKTFADQAVIAIENVRLFTELQETNRALTEAHAQVTEGLDQKIATSEILRIIASSPTDVQPVFDAIAENARRLFRAWYVAVFRLDGEFLQLAARSGGLSGPIDPDHQRVRVGRGSLRGRAILDRAMVHIADVITDPVATETTRRIAESVGWRAVLIAPMLRDGAPIGLIVVTRAELGAFSLAEIALLQTFADQAVIAIENVRLFRELEARNRDVTEALEQQTATSEILRVISSSPTDVQPVFDTIVQSAARLCHAANAGVFLTDGRTLDLPANYGSSSPEALATVRAQYPRPVDLETTAGVAILTRSVVQVPEIEEPSAAEVYTRRVGRLLGVRSMVAVPMMRKGEVVGAINLSRQAPGRFSDAEVELLKTFADQAVIAIENVRLFKELEVANRELSAASQHKSEFLANMSHELRTPLNAIIGFSEVLSERMFGDLNEKQDEYLKDISASGTHLLSLINDILDLSKIEAGRMELELTDFHLPTALDNALTLVRERAGRRGIALHLAVDQRLGQIQGDERKIRQVLLNLLSNAIKFTPEGGRIEVGGVLNDGFVEVSVSDTGVGIAPEDQEAVFEEFRQVGTAAKKVEGTGLGLTLCRKFVELHGGRIWVTSQVGVGSAFTFTVPVHREE